MPRRLGVLSLVLSLSVLLTAWVAVQARPREQWGPQIRTEVRHDTSPPLRELAQVSPQPDRPVAPNRIEQINRLLPAKALNAKLLQELSAQGIDPVTYFQQVDPVIQQHASVDAMPAPQANFEGISQSDQRSVSLVTLTPPDTVGDIGYDPATGKRYYVQWVNLAYSVWDVTGTPQRSLLSKGSALWGGFGWPCETTNDGDPIVLFDQLAQRWLLSQLSQPAYPAGPFYQCLAVSATADPTGSYHRYAFLISDTKLNDYPHFGVWPDGYYLTVNQFNQNTFSWGGAAAVVFERDKMLHGQTARLQYFDLFAVNQSFGGMLPSDLEGSTLPPAGTPNYFVEVDDNSIVDLGEVDALRLWEFHTEWITPTASTFGLGGQPNLTLPVAPFNWLSCVLTGSRSCIPQPGATFVDAVGDRLMHRLVYRNLGDHAVLLLNHTVNAGGGQAGIRWYEVRHPGDAASIYQQGTYASADEHSRWMGSLAMDHIGNIALGYSISSQNLFPSIRYAGRLVNDPLGELPQAEASIVEGNGAQTGSQRWGDYSSMNIDPVDDCTFWYTQEYYAATSSYNWQTRIASFRFPNCTTGPIGLLRGTVRAATSSHPITNARLTISAGPGQPIGLSAPTGAYTYTLPRGVYTLTASAYGYVPGTAYPVTITANLTTVQDVLLNLNTTHAISGFITDTLSGDPLYATIAITGTPFDPPINQITTHPATGYYSVTLAADQLYTLTVSALLHAVQGRSLPALNADRTESFGLTPTTADSGFIGWVRNLNSQQPVSGATVIISPGLQVTTNAAGYFEVLNLPTGFYMATALAPLYAPVTLTHIELRPGVVTVRVFELPAPRLDVVPQTLEHTLTFGVLMTEGGGLVLSNTGSLPLEFAIAEVPPAVWLIESPGNGTVALSAVQPVTMTWDGSSVDQPGTYTTTLHLTTNDPEAQGVTRPVTLTVLPAATQGLLTGVVSTTGSCDVNLAPLAGAQLHFTGSDGFVRSITTDPSGVYHYWLDQAHSPYTITLSALDHPTTSTLVSLSGGVTHTQSFTLRLQQPCLSWSPSAVSLELEAGHTVTRQVIITNSGALPLDVSLYEVDNPPLSGGPDAFGYTGRRSPYSWIDVTDGTPLNLDDDGEATIILPFDFLFYGSASNKLRIGNNGAALFAVTTGEVPLFNQALNSAPDRFIAPYWDDLDSLTGVGNVYWKTIGTAPDRRVVIAWHERPHARGTFGAITFELLLHENGNLAFQYRDTDFSDPAFDRGASATIGLRGEGVAQTLQISHNTPVVQDGQAFCFTRPGNSPCDTINYAWWSFAPGSLTGLIGTPPHRQTITITLTAPAGVGGFYSGTLRLVSTDPFQPDANIPVVLKTKVYRAYLPLIRK
ncbi:hypothetical protein TFLX_00020 [Thermoflexales bacterium]|nr:hypothetical protein TFLX_00020 [Thermoflexales bacterium]